MTQDRPGIGPHEGRELELMKAGQKPLSMFSAVTPDADWFPESEFDALVAAGRLVKDVAHRVVVDRDGREQKVRDPFYALPGEKWRIKAMVLVRQV